MTGRIFKEVTVPKYKSGIWTWDEEEDKLKLIHTHSEKKKSERESGIEIPTQRERYKFRVNMNQHDEAIFRSIFERPENTQDSNVVTIQDIKDICFFMAPSEMMTSRFIDFAHTTIFDDLLNTLVIYFEYFLKVVEFLLIRRDEIKILHRVESMYSLNVYKMFSEYLSQYRILIAREYSKIVLGTHGMLKYHHFQPKTHSSNAIQDRIFQEQLLSFIVYFLWIAFHRRAYKLIANEVNRLFRSGQFNMSENNEPDNIVFTTVEEQILYGKNDERVNFRFQKSPIMQEIERLSLDNAPLLRLGELKYRGTHRRIYELEREVVVPPSQIKFVDLSHGILGIPKILFNTLLVVDWNTVRKRNYSLQYDPYGITRQPYIWIPSWQNFQKKHEHADPHFVYEVANYDHETIRRQRSLWLKRDEIIRNTGGVDEFATVLEKCAEELQKDWKNFSIDSDAITKNFFIDRARHRKLH